MTISLDITHLCIYLFSLLEGGGGGSASFVSCVDVKRIQETMAPQLRRTQTDFSSAIRFIVVVFFCVSKSERKASFRC